MERKSADVDEPQLRVGAIVRERTANWLSGTRRMGRVVETMIAEVTNQQLYRVQFFRYSLTDWYGIGALDIIRE